MGGIGERQVVGNTRQRGCNNGRVAVLYFLHASSGKSLSKFQGYVGVFLEKDITPKYHLSNDTILVV